MEWQSAGRKLWKKVIILSVLSGGQRESEEEEGGKGGRSFGRSVAGKINLLGHWPTKKASYK